MEAGDHDIPFRAVEMAGIEVVDENEFGGGVVGGGGAMRDGRRGDDGKQGDEDDGEKRWFHLAILR